MVWLISARGSAVVVKRNIDKEALTKKILDISREYLDLRRLRAAVREAESKQKMRKSRPASPHGKK
jgi:hypothetical protein